MKNLKTEQATAIDLICADDKDSLIYMKMTVRQWITKMVFI